MYDSSTICIKELTSKLYLKFDFHCFLFQIQGSKLTGAQGPLAPEFFKWPPVFEVGGLKGPHIFEPPTYKFMCLGHRISVSAPTFLRAGALRASTKKIEFRALYILDFQRGFPNMS